MAQLDAEKIKKLKKGEAVGTAALVFCGAVLIYFIALFSTAAVRGDALLQTIVWSTAPALMVLGIAVSAYCNIRYSNEIEKLIKSYVVSVFVENAEAMHPERKSLSFFITIEGTSAVITVNGYNEKIICDFSAFKKLSISRKATVLNIIADTLSDTFCRLYERGATYTSVDYREKDGLRRKSGKTVPVIMNGVPERRAANHYLKSK